MIREQMCMHRYTEREQMCMHRYTFFTHICLQFGTIREFAAMGKGQTMER